MTLFGARVNEETFFHAKEYFFWITLGIPFYMFGQALNPMIRSDGSPNLAMASTLAGALVNIILDPIFGQTQYAQIPMAVLGIVMRFFQIVISVSVGLAAGCIPVVGYNIGPGLRLHRNLHGAGGALRCGTCSAAPAAVRTGRGAVLHAGVRSADLCPLRRSHPVHLSSAGRSGSSHPVESGSSVRQEGERVLSLSGHEVTLVLDGVDITCTVAPAVIFYNVYECDEAWVAYDAGEAEGTGLLSITAENEGLDSELHLTVNGGQISIQAQNDGINTNEDNVSVTTINGGGLQINAGLGVEGESFMEFTLTGSVRSFSGISGK